MQNKIMQTVAVATTLFTTTVEADWANNQRYEKANEHAKMGQTILMGDSITQNWAAHSPNFFEENKLIGRGISGQTTTHMVCRFQQDVIALKPKAVVILAGTNDMAENNGPIAHPLVLNNIKSMVELARAHSIHVTLGSIPPADRFGWRASIKDAALRIAEMNKLIKAYAEAEKIPFIDYYTKLADENGGMGQYADDGVHPNTAGYKVMEATLLPYIN